MLLFRADIASVVVARALNMLRSRNTLSEGNSHTSHTHAHTIYIYTQHFHPPHFNEIKMFFNKIKFNM